MKSPHLIAQRRRIIIVTLVVLALLAYVDWITGPNVSVTCFYLVPVFYLSWYGGVRVGLAVAALHAMVWFFIDLESIPHLSGLIFWNFLVRFVTFAAVVWLVQLCRNLTGEVERLVTDKTSILQREVETRAANENAIRRLATELSIAEDSERRRLGLELHDSMGQSLTLLKLRLESTASKIPAGDQRLPEIQGSLALLSSVIQQARTLTFELYPSMLDQLGLSETLRHYCQQLESHVTAHLRVSDSGPTISLPQNVASFLFRAVKELINNALKHGAAREVVLQIRRRPEQVRVVVTDDGTGFDPNAAPVNGRSGLGLAWMRERVRTLGGSLEIVSGAGDGTRVAIDLPVHITSNITAERKDEPHGQAAAG